MAAIDPSFYFERLYLLQDAVLQRVNALDTGFYLGGGTATSRGYLHHRFSDDLDLFVNKDFADIWGFCSQMQLSLTSAITNADSKAAGIFPVEVARILDSASQDDWAAIKWITAPDPIQFVSSLRALAESLILNP